MYIWKKSAIEVGTVVGSGASSVSETSGEESLDTLLMDEGGVGGLGRFRCWEGPGTAEDDAMD